jgi:hypothetical protein
VDFALMDAGAAPPVTTAPRVSVPAAKATACVPALNAPQSPKPGAKPVVASVPKEPEGLTEQLADGLMLAFKTFTGR